jgi:protein ImuB
MANPHHLGWQTMTQPTELYACLYVREFPAQALLRMRPDLRSQPCAVVEGEPPLQTVCSLNARAHALGVERGMTRVELETFAGVHALQRSLVEEASARAALLECADSFSPRMEEVSDSNRFACVLDIAGTEKLFGPPPQLALRILNRIGELGLRASIAMSANFHAAVSMARSLASRTALIPPGEERRALAPLSLSVLRLTDEQSEIFQSWGIATLGILAALPEKELVARIGQQGRQLLEMARGEHPHLFVPLTATFSLEERMELESPVEQLDSLLFVAGILLEQLTLRAAARALALASVTLTLQLEGGMVHERTVRPALPSNDRRLWLKLVHLDLEAHPPGAAIVSLRMTAEPGHTSTVQLGLFAPQQPEPHRLDVTLARIRAIVGEDAVGSPDLKDTHQPDAFRMQPFSVPRQSSATGPAAEKRTTSAMRFLRPAEAVRVVLRNRQPKSFRFRDRNYDIDRAYGPWTASGDWWNQNVWGSEQWDIIASTREGQMLCGCLVRDLVERNWMMVALYD